MRFRSLHVYNNWNHLTYHWVPFKDTFDAPVALDPERGGTACVRWPDGTEQWVDFTSTTKVVNTHDMGHVYRTRQYIPMVGTTVQGLPVTVPLSSLKVGEIKQDHDPIKEG